MGFLLFRSSIFMSLREYFSSYLEYLLSVDISFVKDNWGGWKAFIEVFCWQTNQTFRGFQRQENYFLVVDNGITPPNFTFTFVFNHHHHHHHKRAEKLLLNCSVDKQERLRGTFVPRYLFPGHQGAEKGLTNKEDLEGLSCQEDYFLRDHYPSSYHNNLCHAQQHITKKTTKFFLSCSNDKQNNFFVPRRLFPTRSLSVRTTTIISSYTLSCWTTSLIQS